MEKNSVNFIANISSTFMGKFLFSFEYCPDIWTPFQTTP